MHISMGINMKRLLAGFFIGLFTSVSITALWYSHRESDTVPADIDFTPAVSTDSIVSAQVNQAPAMAQAMFEEAVTSPTVPGISVAIAGKEGIIWAEGFGWTDVENQVPMSTMTKMRIGSVAKPFTTAALMRLYDQGKIDLDVDVRTYVSSWPEKHAAITLRQLTSHTSGIRHYEGDEFFSNEGYSTVVDSLEIFKTSPLKFEPGSEQSYSTYAWTLVSAAIEGADGERDFKEIMQQEVFIPLGMNNTALDQQYEIIQNRQRPYTVDEDRLINAPQTDHSYKWAGGGFIASTSDVARFAVAHIDGDFLREETVTEMFTKAELTGGDSSQFGIGWQIGFDRYLDRHSEDQDAMRIMQAHPNAVMHSGGSMGGTTMLILCPDHERAVAVVKNVSRDSSSSHFLLALKTLDIFQNH
jgi:serine beta-lactamase-like protein LACTB